GRGVASDVIQDEAARACIGGLIAERAHAVADEDLVLARLGIERERETIFAQGIGPPFAIEVDAADERGDLAIAGGGRRRARPPQAVERGERAIAVALAQQ